MHHQPSKKKIRFGSAAACQIDIPGKCTIEPLNAYHMGLLSKVSDGCELLRMALYADDAAVFIKPSKQDLQITSCILGIFAEASGLSTNLDKTQFYLSFSL
jgi:hypothetical protein